MSGKQFETLVICEIEMIWSRVLPSIANEVLKSVVAQYNAIELIVKREQVCSVFYLCCISVLVKERAFMECSRLWLQEMKILFLSLQKNMLYIYPSVHCNPKGDRFYRSLLLGNEYMLPNIFLPVYFVFLHFVFAEQWCISLILTTGVMQVSAQVRNRLQERAKDFFMVLDDVSIVSIALNRAL